ncbi:MAG: GTP cyclohydrolase I FolE [Planctomycetes bacterium]|nr:GTP cyclohydrolase I FolE [Planctomycetota bacterium]
MNDPLLDDRSARHHTAPVLPSGTPALRRGSWSSGECGCGADHAPQGGAGASAQVAPAQVAPAEPAPAHASPATFDLPRIERAVREILLAIGEDPARDGIRDTPRRVAKAYAEIFGGLRQTAHEHLGRVFEQKSDELITVTGIGFHSMCEHHLLPFFGKAHVAYLPKGGRVVGLSKLARTVEVFAKRPQLQERLTEQVADALMEHLDPAGCVVMVEAEHLCMKMRGVKTSDSVMTTFVRRGVFRSDEARGERAMALVRELALKCCA